MAAGGVLGFAFLLVLPWALLFALLTLLASIQNDSYGVVAGFEVGGFRVSPAHLVLIPFGIRAYLTTRENLRMRWGFPEWLLVAFALIQPVITWRKAPSPNASLGALGLVALGILAYLTVYMATCTHRRVLIAAKVFLWMVLLNALYGVVAMAAHVAAGTTFGISTRSAYGNGVYGLALEHDIFGSTCAMGAIAFYVLWRERNPIISSRISGPAVWICGAGMLLGLARGAWIGFGLAFLAVLILPRTRRRRIRGLERVGVSLIVLATVGLGASYVLGSSSTLGEQLEGVEEKLGDLVNLDTGTGAARLGETATALQDWEQSPIIGLGTGTYEQRHPQRVRTNYIGNIYLRALYETGIVGVPLLVGFLLLLFWPNRALLFGTGDLAPVARALTAGGAVLTVAYAATDSTLLVWPWILFALIRAARALNERETNASRTAGSLSTPAVPDTPVPALGNGQGAAPAPLRPVGSRRLPAL
jgi:hypothetical protein